MSPHWGTLRCSGCAILLPILVTTAVAKLSLGTGRIGNTQPQMAAKVGIQAKELDPHQLSQRMAIQEAFIAHVRRTVVEQHNALIKAAGIDQICLGWAGVTDRSGQHFFHVQGPTFIAEICNHPTEPEKNDANHIHAIWSDMTGDFNMPLAS